MLSTVVRCPMCGEPVWRDRSRCGSCAIVLGTEAGGAAGSVPPARDSEGRAGGEAVSSEALGVAPGAPVVIAPARMVGRDAPLDRVARHLRSELSRGRGAAVLAHGPIGSGKSAFLAAAAARAAGPGLPVSRIEVRLGRGAPEPLAPIERLVAGWIAEGSADWRDLASMPKRLARRIRDLGPLAPAEARETEIRLGALAGLHGVAAPRDEEEVLRRPIPFLDALAEVLRLDAARRPLLVLLDGLERGTDEGRFLLSQIVRRLADAPVAWLSGARTVDAASLFAGAVEIEIVHLVPLGLDDLERLISDGLGAPASRELVSLVLRMSQGYPGPALDAVRSLDRSGAILRTEDGCDVAPAAPSRRLGPQTLEALIGVRWERLGAADRETLQNASILGEVVWDEAIVALGRFRRSSPLPDAGYEARHIDELEAVRARLAESVRLGFLTEVETAEFDGTREYAFALDDLRAFVYGTVPGDVRAGLHLVAAHWLSVRAAGRPGFTEAIAKHLQAGGGGREAARLYGEAAAEARRRTLLDRAVDLFQRKLDLLDPSDHPERWSTLHDLGTVEVSMGRYAAAETSFQSMLETGWRIGAPAKVAVALSKLGRLHRVRGDYPAAIETTGEALRLFRSCGDLTGVAGTLTDLGSLHYLIGEYRDARRCHREALALRREMEDDRGTAVALLQLAAVDRVDGLLARATTKAEEALRLGEGASAPEELAQAMNLLGILAYDRGEIDAALGYVQEGLALAAGADRRVETYLLNNLGEIRMRAGRLDEAAEPLKRALDLASENEDMRALGEVQRNIARLALAQGRIADAAQFADRAAAVAERIGSAEARAAAWVTLAEVRAAGGRPGTPGADQSPDALFGRAVEILRSIGHRVELAQALMRLGAYLRAAGRPRDAVTPLAEARRLLIEQGSHWVETVAAAT